MLKKKVFLDCDPGHDDAFAIMLAAANTELLGITTVGGNGVLENVTRNALKVLEVIGRTDIPVAAGCDRPMVAPLVTAANVHGESGMDGPDLPEPTAKPLDKHGVDFMIETLLAHEDVTLIAVGPLTNVAMALRREPAIKQHIREISIMGGGLYCGNWTPAAEFNIFVDPEAASVVFNSGVHVKMSGVNLTRQCRIRKADREVLRSFGNRTGAFAADLLDFFTHEYPGLELHSGSMLHDACAVAWVIDEQIVQGAALHVDVELTGTLTRGMTVCDFRHLQTYMPDVDIDLGSPFTNDSDEDPQFRGKAPNAEVGVRFDLARFKQLFFNTFRAYS